MVTRSAEVGKRSARARGSGIASLSGALKQSPSPRMPRAISTTPEPFRSASASSSHPARPYGRKHNASAYVRRESSKYRFCAWKCCGARYIPSLQTTLESSLILPQAFLAGETPQAAAVVCAESSAVAKKGEGFCGDLSLSTLEGCVNERPQKEQET